MKTRHLLFCVVAAVSASVLAAAPAFSDSEFDGGLGGSDGAWGWKPPSHDRIGLNDGGGRSGHMYGMEDGYGNGNGGGCGGGSCGGGGGVFSGAFGGGALGGGNALIPLIISLMGGGGRGMMQPNGFFPGMNGGFPGLNGGYPGGNNGYGQPNPYGVIFVTPTATPTATPTPTPASIVRRFGA